MLFYRWHPQLYLRYAPIVSYIAKLNLARPKILEVGSGSLGIGPYLKRELVGIDIDFSGPDWPQMTKVIATGKSLPFRNKSFDIVICTDTLEHIPPHLRQRVTAELLRVTRNDLILAFPAGNLAAKQDRQLDRLYRRRFGQPFPFLTEHIRYGLPDTNQVKTWLKPARITTFSAHNLKLRRWFMSGWMTKLSLVNVFFRKILLLFLPLLKLLDQPLPHYRTYIFAKIKP
jgi:hypothetical protein